MVDRQLDEEAIFHVAREILDLEALRVSGPDLFWRCATTGSCSVPARVHDMDQRFLNRTSTRRQQNSLQFATLGQQIGRYKLLQQIGEGGFGVVYMAEQQRPVHRKVALKIIKPGMDTRAVVARFEAERQALALMDHPNIARVFDGGTTESGTTILRHGTRQRCADYGVLRCK